MNSSCHGWHAKALPYNSKCAKCSQPTVLYFRYSVYLSSLTIMFFCHSSLQRRRQRQCASGEVMQPLLAMPGRLPSAPEVPGHASVRPKVLEVCRASHWGLWSADHPVPGTRGPGWRRRTERAPAGGSAAAASARPATTGSAASVQRTTGCYYCSSSQQ